MPAMDKATYWGAVVGHIAANGITKRAGGLLDWETVEVLCENHGFSRANIPDPLNMARTALHLLEPVEF